MNILEHFTLMNISFMNISFWTADIMSAGPINYFSRACIVTLDLLFSGPDKFVSGVATVVMQNHANLHITILWTAPGVPVTLRHSVCESVSLQSQHSW